MGNEQLKRLIEIAAALRSWHSTPEQIADAYKGIHEVVNTGAIRSYAPLLPLFLSLRGNPYTIYSKDPGAGYFPMEPMFKKDMPFQLLLKCGRQISKSTSLAAQGLLQSITTPYFDTLFVTPLFEQARRLSSNYVKPFIVNSPIRDLIIDTTCNDSVLQRTFINNSSMYFTYAYLSADRVRGLSVSKMAIDEVQDVDWDFIPIIRECMSASKYGVSQYSGTPKTMDNTIEELWQKSSKAEFCIKCEACNRWNIPNLEHDILKMIRQKGLVCAKCERLIDPRKNGVWIHQVEDYKNSFAGYHVPQIIMPMHYELPNKWAIIWQKYNDGKTSQSSFHNECLGESCDVGAKLLTITDIKKASVESIHNTLDASRLPQIMSRHTLLTLGIDWGGQTAPIGRHRLAHMAEDSAEATSFTTAAVIAHRHDGKQQCVYAHRFPLNSDHLEESKGILDIFRTFRCRFLAHDFGGSGAARETILIQAGLDATVVIPLLYTGFTNKGIMSYVSADESHPRYYWSIDKSRSLMTICLGIKTGHIFLPNYEESKEISHDFLALIEDKIERPGASDVLHIRRQPKQRDDFAHSVNYGCLTNWQYTSSWPKFSL